jgi:asparagine synthase (glutamine-hydrolysing)
MCGISGYLSNKQLSAGQMESIARAMSDAIVHRGPDDSGTFIDASAGVAFGFRRLSIVDLSPEGHQPMLSPDSRFAIEFNGEIYNYLEIRKDLEERGWSWRGHSDTEVMLAAFVEWGVEDSVKRFNGMFAFAAWDKVERRLWLARDRMGKKPLYYGFSGGAFLWASELKALTAHPSFEAEIDRSSIALFLKFGYVPAPYSIYQGIFKLPAASLLAIKPGTHQLPTPKPYWSAVERAVAARRDPFRGSDSEATGELDSLLRDAVAKRMIADVPLGAFLSGGIDSSAVVSLMQAQSSRPVRTFSIGFGEDEFNEARHAKEVARHLGTDHTELYVSGEEALAVVPKLPEIYDEPFADSSQIPTYLVSKLARQHVTVALSGDGGDEMFGGYNRYFWGQRIWRGLRPVPRSVRGLMARTMRGASGRAIGAGINALRPITPARLRVSNASDKLLKLAEVLDIRSAEELYGRLVYHWKDPLATVAGAEERPTAIDASEMHQELRGVVERMMILDTVTYLPDDILVKVDRATMAVSLEGRAPLLDYRVFEFAWRLPLDMKIRGGRGKWILRQVLQRYVPEALIERPKMGFGIPLAAWLRGPLRDWADSLLDERRLRQEGFLRPEGIREKWLQHLRGEREWHYYLWDVLMFQAWLDHAQLTRVSKMEPPAPVAVGASRG